MIDKRKKNFLNYKKVDHALYKYFKESMNADIDDELSDDSHLWHIVLKNDIESLSVKHGFDVVKEATEKIITSKRFSNIMIDWDNVERAVKVRSDWPAVLRKVKDGAKISHLIGYAFGDDDLITLIELHKKNRFRKKIEDLLEDCNFHDICGHLSTKQYDQAFKDVTNAA